MFVLRLEHKTGGVRPIFFAGGTGIGGGQWCYDQVSAAQFPVPDLDLQNALMGYYRWENVYKNYLWDWIEVQ